MGAVCGSLVKVWGQCLQCGAVQCKCGGSVVKVWASVGGPCESVWEVSAVWGSVGQCSVSVGEALLKCGAALLKCGGSVCSVGQCSVSVRQYG